VTETALRRVVVVGAGLAGVSTCVELRRRGYDGGLVLLDAGPFPHDRPPLSKDYLAGIADDAKIRLQPPGWFDEHHVDLRAGARAVALRPAARSVELADGREEHADAVVIATGGNTRPLPVPGGDTPAVHMLRTVDDARQLREVLRPGTRLVVIGAGLIGAEVASTARRLGVDVVLVDPVNPPLRAAVGLRVATFLHAQHRDYGIDVRTAAVDRIEQQGSGATVYLSGPAEPVTADVVLAAIGIIPATALAESADLAVDGGVLVDDRHRSSNPAVFAVGDAARARRGDGSPGTRVEHWEAAQKGGAAVAAALLGAEPPVKGAPWFWTDRHGCHVEVAGSMTVAEITARRGTLGDGPYMEFTLAQGRCVGAVAVDDSRNLRAARRLIDAGLQVDPDALADPGADLRKLARR
jgi:3-phenylpropionate/trans-cinnamate dioxygenase ferredoxin reductase component